MFVYADKINSELTIQLDQLAMMGVTITDNWVSLWYHEKFPPLEEHPMHTLYMYQTEHHNIRSAVKGKESTNLLVCLNLLYVPMLLYIDVHN